jgi:Arabinofuranosyltransferase N terminal
VSGHHTVVKPQTPAIAASRGAESATAPQSSVESAGTAEAPKRPMVRFFGNPAVAAILTWVVAGPLAYLIPRVPHFSGGAGSLRSLAVPLILGLSAVVVVCMIAMRRAAPWLAGVSAGGFAAWTVLSLSTALRGTPYPFYGLLGDAGRVTGMATRYSVTPFSSDAIIPGLPSEYPPLFPWIVGRFSALIDVPAWRLVGDFEIIFTGLAIVAGFVLWQRLLSPWLALAVTTVGFMSFPYPIKAYELLTIMIFFPWVLLTLTNPPRGRLHWLVSGLLGGLIIVTYFGWFVFAFVGILALVYLTWRRETDRAAFAWYLAKVGGVAFVTASWFLVPLLYAKVTIGGATVADLYGSPNMFDNFLPFFQFTSSGAAGLQAIINLIGLVGMIWLRDKVWWARPLLIMVVGAYLLRIVGGVVFVLTQHTLLSQYTPSIYMFAMTIAAPMTVVHAAPRILQRLSVTPPKGATAIGLAAVVGWAGLTFCMDWTPGAGGRYSDYSERAYREPYPDGHYAIAVDNPTPWLPVNDIQHAVEGVLGSQHDAVALSFDERLFSFLPWHGYIGNDLGSSLSHTFERLSDVEHLATVTDPSAFTYESQHLTYGRVDVFVLKRVGPDSWRWTFHRGFNQQEAEIDFSRAQFSPADWVVVDTLPENTVVIIRKEAPHA